MTMNDGKLIELVSSYPHLYDRKRSDFKDAKKKHNSWVEIAKLLGYTVEEVQNRWKYLREKYISERNSKKLPSGSGTSDKGQWEWSKSLTWLDMYITKRKTKSNVEEHYLKENYVPDTPETEKSQDLVDFTNNLPFLEFGGDLINESDRSNLTFLTTASNDSQESSQLRQAASVGDDLQTPQTKKGKDATAISALVDIKNCIKTVQSQMESKRDTNKRPADDDEDALFGRSVTAFLRKIKSGKVKREFKQEVFAKMMVLEETEENSQV